MSFTYKQIHDALVKVKTGADFPQLVKDLKSIGVIYYDSFLTDGHTRYFGTGTFVLEGENTYPEINVSNSSSVAKLKEALQVHQLGKTDYRTFCTQAADAGVEKWRTDITAMTVTYFDRKGNALTVEAIPEV